MRAVLCREWGAVADLQLGDAPSPIPADDEVLIEVKAVGINYADAIMVAGKYQTKPPLPFSPGLEAAGIVAARGDRVTRFKPGDRVMAILAHGGLAELAVAPEAETFAIPDGMSFEEAGAFPVAYISSHVALRWQGRLEPGEKPEMRLVRFRTLGCYPLSGAVESFASTLDEIVAEMRTARISERQGRLIDGDENASMEKKKREGYF